MGHSCFADQHSSNWQSVLSSARTYAALQLACSIAPAGKNPRSRHTHHAHGSSWAVLLETVTSSAGIAPAELGSMRHMCTRLELDGQSVAVPSGHVLDAPPLQHLVLHDDVLQHLRSRRRGLG